MAEYYKAGLHKQISSIFDGVPASDGDSQQQPQDVPPTQNPNQQDLTQHNEEQVAPIVPVIQTVTDNTEPVPAEVQSPPPVSQKNAPSKESEPNIIMKIIRKIPWKQIAERVSDKLFAAQPGVNVARQKTMTILVPILFIIFIVVFVKVIKVPSHKAKKAPVFGPSSAVAAAAPSGSIDWKIPLPYPETLRDPMQLGSVTAAAQTGTSGLVVKGIVYSRDRPSAIVGDQIVHEGDVIFGVTVVKINKSSVEFEANGETLKLRVNR